MDKESKIIITGAAGFIGSCMVSFLNEEGFKNLILADEFGDAEKDHNLHSKKFSIKVERENLFAWLKKEKPEVKFVFHLGARTDTTEFDYSIHEHLNVEYSKKIWHYCTENNIPVVYASSAATYGAGELGYKDDHAIVEKLQPLNPYGISKNEFDKWALKEAGEQSQPPFWAGVKFFNVYGPNEYHKARMASMIFHSYHQIKQNGFVKLFKSHKEEFKDGEQLRDFIYVKDVVKMCYWFCQWSTVNDQRSIQSGIYNIGTGESRSFNDLVNAVFAALDVTSNIQYVDMPSDLRDTYQYFTEAEMQKIKNAGYNFPLNTLEEGVCDYVKNYLSKNVFY